MTTFKEIAEDDMPLYALSDAAASLIWDEGDSTTEHLERLSPEARLVYVLTRFDDELNNGGFVQFFDWMGGQVDEVLSHLETLGASEQCRALQLAVARFPEGDVPRDREKRQEVLQSLMESHEDGDRLFNDLDDLVFEHVVEFAQLLEGYIREHPDVAIEA